MIAFVTRFAVPLIAFVMSSTIDAAAQPPNGTLRVAYKQKESGTLSASVHHVTLSCWDGRCELTTLTLNQCFPFGGGEAFVPKIERSRTDEGNLDVRAPADGVVLVEERHAQATLNYRFKHSTRRDAELARTLRLREERFFDGLMDFSGAAVKQSDIVQKVLTWELVPLKGRTPTLAARCRMLLDGVPD